VQEGIAQPLVSKRIAQFGEVLADLVLQARTLLELLAQRGGEAGHLVFEGFAAVEYALEFGVFLLDRFQRIVEQAVDALGNVGVGLAVSDFTLGVDGDLGAGLEEVPAG